jgi:CTP synthase
VQFHPEFKSKPRKPHPLFAGFVEASYRRKQASPAADAPAEPARGTSTITA